MMYNLTVIVVAQLGLEFFGSDLCSNRNEHFLFFCQEVFHPLPWSMSQTRLQG